MLPADSGSELHSPGYLSKKCHLRMLYDKFAPNVVYFGRECLPIHLPRELTVLNALIRSSQRWWPYLVAASHIPRSPRSDLGP